jgi:hypothetical protein
VAHYNTQPRFEPIEKRDFKQTIDEQPADNQQTASANHRHMSKASNEPHTPKNPLRAVSPPQTPPSPPQNHITPQTKLCPDAHPRGRKRTGQRHCDKNELRQPPIRPNSHTRRRQTPVCAATRWAERHGKMAQHALGSPKKFALMRCISRTAKTPNGNNKWQILLVLNSFSKQSISQIKNMRLTFKNLNFKSNGLNLYRLGL